MVNTILSLLANTAVAAALLPPFEAGKKIVPGAYIVEYEEGQDAASALSALGGNLNHVRVQFNFENFKGVSIQLSENQTASNATFSLHQTPSVKKVWPVHVYDRPDFDVIEANPSALNARADNFSPHVMMQVDQLRSYGYDGQGVKLAVIDSGVDYKHPAFGGCFGPGCKVSFGYDFVGDDFNGLNQPHPDNDPMDCGSHGTHVSGIIAAGENAAGFTGVAPSVTLGMYKVFGCSGGTGTDILMAAAARAADEGAKIISCSVGGASGWSDDAFSYLLAKLADERGIVSTVAAGNDGTRGAFYPSGASNNPMVNSVAAADLPESQGTGNTPSYFSSWGPTMEMNFKPQFTAPGRDILSTLPNNRYGYASGTSMSTPMAAGVIALLNQALGPVSPAWVQNLLSANAKPLYFSAGSKTYGFLAPTAQQGGGLIQAKNAIYSRTQISPASLSFNDTDHLNDGMPFVVRNAGNETVDYELLIRPAITVYILPSDGSPYPSNFPNDQTTTTGVLSASLAKFSIGAGQTQTIRMYATPPSAVDTKRLALWSGFLYIKGSDSSEVSIPYQGLAGSLRSATTLPSDATYIARSSDKDRKPVSANTEFVLPHPGSATGNDELPLIYPNLALGTAQLTAQIIHIASGQVMADIPGVPYYQLTRGNEFGFYWTGALSNGYYVGADTYKIRLRALRIYGDPNNQDDWDVSDSVPIKISYRQ